MANQIPTPAELIARMKANAKAVAELNKGVTVASGAVVGGPIAQPPPVNPAAAP